MSRVEPFYMYALRVNTCEQQVLKYLDIDSPERHLTFRYEDKSDDESDESDGFVVGGSV